MDLVGFLHPLISGRSLPMFPLALLLLALETLGRPLDLVTVPRQLGVKKGEARCFEGGMVHVAWLRGVLSESLALALALACGIALVGEST